MRWFQVGSVGLLLVACGGSAARTPGSAGSASSAGSAGVAGEPSAAAGTASALPGEGGAGGVSPVGMGGADASGGDAAGAGGVSGAGGFDAGAAGAGGQPVLDCAGLDCLLGAELRYVPDRAWQRPATPVSISSELSESDYAPQALPPWAAHFSSDAQMLTLTPTAGGPVAYGTRDPERKDEAWFELTLFAGGRFVVQASGNELHAELTVYGSGMPVISSTRGLLEAR